MEIGGMENNKDQDTVGMPCIPEENTKAVNQQMRSDPMNLTHQAKVALLDESMSQNSDQIFLEGKGEWQINDNVDDSDSKSEQNLIKVRED